MTALTAKELVMLLNIIEEVESNLAILILILTLYTRRLWRKTLLRICAVGSISPSLSRITSRC